MLASKVGNVSTRLITNLWRNQVKSNAAARLASTVSEQLDEFKDDTAEYLSESKTSPAMVAYLKRAKAHSEFMEKHNHEFQVGKRHLANMMGRDPEHFTQEDVDEAIDYLFPSGLYDKQARPLMKPPETIFAAKKDAEFDESGRPFHWLFYTTLPNFFSLMHSVVSKLKELNKFEDEQVRKGISTPENSAVSMGGMEWLPLKTLEKRLIEEIPEEEYKQFISLMDRFMEHPYAFMARDTYEPLRKTILVRSSKDEAVKPILREDGVAFVTTKDCYKGTARADVTVYYPGTGKVSINEKDLAYFEWPQSREMLRPAFKREEC